MNRRLALAAPLVLATAVVAAGCSSSGSSSAGGSTQNNAASSSPVKGGTLTYGEIADLGAGGFDPYATVAAPNFGYIEQIYQPLLSQNAQGKITAGIADTWKQTSPTVYTFHIRPGVKFSDGSALTASDVAFSLLQMRDKGLDQAQYYTDVKTVTAPDASNVKVVLKAPSASFLQVVSNPTTCFIVKKSWYLSTSSTKRQSMTNGTGPFTLKSWQHGAQVTLDANSHYWQKGEPYLSSVVFKVVPDDQTRLADLEQGSVNMMWTKDPTQANQAKSAGLVVGQGGASRTVPLDINATQGPLANLEVRQAISKGIDRQEIIALAVGGQGALSLNMPPGAGGIKPTAATPNFAYDPAGARALLKKAGQTNVTVPLTYSSDAAFALDVPMVEAVKSQLSKVGINVQLHGVPFSVALSQALSGKYTGMLLMPLAYSPTPSGYLRFMQNTPQNVTGAQGSGHGGIVHELSGWSLTV
ncbi:ABC transporter substrate-binding protein [Leekyejoonella antrihumi]|nr:ABC transporter substrate-binding protein [Leekyejoonella antrihumi]